MPRSSFVTGMDAMDVLTVEHRCHEKGGGVCREGTIGVGVDGIYSC
jgi:hypothetical protein